MGVAGFDLERVADDILKDAVNIGCLRVAGNIYHLPPAGLLDSVSK